MNKNGDHCIEMNARREYICSQKSRADLETSENRDDVIEAAAYGGLLEVRSQQKGNDQKGLTQNLEAARKKTIAKNAGLKKKSLKKHSRSPDARKRSPSSVQPPLPRYR